MKSREQIAQNALRKAELALEQTSKQFALAEKVCQAQDANQAADNKSADIESANSLSANNPSANTPSVNTLLTDTNTKGGQPAAERLPQSVDQAKENE